MIKTMTITPGRTLSYIVVVSMFYICMIVFFNEDKRSMAEAAFNTFIGAASFVVWNIQGRKEIGSHGQTK